MNLSRDHIIEVFGKLGERLTGFGNSPADLLTINHAYDENPWFTPESVKFAFESICRCMLDLSLLREWSAAYPVNKNPRKIVVICAGNIPLVGFFDILCVLCSGHLCYVKPSSKDKILMDFIIDEIKKISDRVPVSIYNGETPDAIIGTGNDNTKRYFQNVYEGLPAIFRGNRSSVAILTGCETADQLNCLTKDIFLYSGLGCRNISHILIPQQYNFRPLTTALDSFEGINRKYISNFLQRSVILHMQKTAFIKGDFYILREDRDFPLALSEITYHRYSDIQDIVSWINSNMDSLQCIVSECTIDGISVTPFEHAQQPSLSDYADNIDVMEFLVSL